MMKHKINNTGWIWNGDEREGWNEAKPKGNAERFFNLHFLDQKWSKDLEFALAKLRGLCKYLANVYNSHSHVYGLHRLILCTKSKAEKSMQWGESSFKRAQRYLNIKYGEVSLQIESAAAKTTTSLWNRNEKGIGKTRKMWPQANSAQYNTQGWDVRKGGGGGVKWRGSGGGAAPLH